MAASAMISLSTLTRHSSWTFSFVPTTTTSLLSFNKNLHPCIASSHLFGSSSSSINTQEEEAVLSLTNVEKQPILPPIPPNSKRLFLVRHGEVIPPGGVHGVFYGALDVPLSPLGEMEAKAAGLYLQQFELEKIASSPLKRAIFGAEQTKRMQQNDFPSDVDIYDGFSELDRGAWCGKTKVEIGPELMDRFDNCDETVTPEGGESYPTVKRRVLQARDKLLATMTPGRQSAMVSHLQVTRSILSDALGIPTEEMVGLKIATASITCIDYDGDAGNKPTVHFQSFKPEAGLEKSTDGGNVV